MGTLSILNKLSKDSLLAGTGVWVDYDPKNAESWPKSNGLYLVKVVVGCNKVNELKTNGFWSREELKFSIPHPCSVTKNFTHTQVLQWLLEEYK